MQARVCHARAATSVTVPRTTSASTVNSWPTAATTPPTSVKTEVSAPMSSATRGPLPPGDRCHQGAVAALHQDLGWSYVGQSEMT